MNDEIQIADERDIPEEDMLLLMDGEDAFQCIDFNKMPRRADADAIWRAIAAGVLPDTKTVKWAKWVAQAIVKDVLDNRCPSEQRKDHALKAIKISGHGNPYAEEEDKSFEHLAFAFFLSKAIGRLGSTKDQLKLSQEIRKLKMKGFFRGKTEAAVRKHFERWRKQSLLKIRRLDEIKMDKK
jgi:hypothetical protein